MTEYVVLLPGDESRWEQADTETRKRVYAVHEEFTRLLAERGHTVTGGAELEHSRRARVVRGQRGSVTVTEGPYAETVEQLSGFYVVQSDDLDDLLDLCGLLAGEEGVEVRAALPSSQPSSDPEVTG